MAFSVLIHIANEDPIMAEMEKLPQGGDTVILALNPRMKDGKDVRYLAANVTQVVYPISRITFIEVMPGEEEEKVVGFVRE